MLWVRFGQWASLAKAKGQHWRHRVAPEQSTPSPFPIAHCPFPILHPHLKQSYPKLTLS